MSTESELLAPDTTSRDLRTVILLAGRVGRNPFADGIGRSVLDLPVAPGRTVFDVWTERFGELADQWRLSRLLVRIAVDQEGDAPVIAAAGPGTRVQFEIVRDVADYRGTAGVVKDLTQDLGDSDLVFVASANQVQREPLARFLPELVLAGEGVTLVPHGPSELAGAFVLRRERLRAVPDVGFVDLKEQAIPEAIGAGSLRVSRRPRGASLPVRTLEEYISALRAIHAPGGTDDAQREDPFAESWQPRFSIVETGADVDPSAVLQDSVVLAGGRVEAGAVVARAVVCPGGVVRRGETVVEALAVA